jgi:hypothetical protein
MVSSLATDTEYVRSTLATYANDLISLGIVGLRLDAAKRKSRPTLIQEWLIILIFDTRHTCVGH